ncbi:MAG: tryptophan synthase subunit alpha [Syntrophorhabdaceae bacterium]|nr:tryptophan synthase subunit alpha [Syntrophorhabdaceae bacterium]
MKRITYLLTTLTAGGQKAFIPYITAGDPDCAATLRVLHVLEAQGADIVEIGVPFSDPMADGPVIEAAMERALKSGTTLGDILRTVREFRKTSSLPVILMGYFNPFHAYGIERFAADAGDAGVDAVLTVDLPPEEAGEFSALLRKQGMASIFLATPLTDTKRMVVLKKMAQAFIYLVSVTGITGERNGLAAGLEAKAKELKEEIGLPVVLGFGISGPLMVSQYRDIVDGFVVGSAVVKRWEEAASDPAKLEELKTFIASMARECHRNDIGSESP